uniref:Reverse transcriptase n=1 Tax=Sarcophilus harrisii TaxID=9305 RepID=A0A7N4Q242_SARHA
MKILPKLIYLFSAIAIRLPKNYFNDLEKITTKFIWKNKRSRISRELMKKKSNEGNLAVPELKLRCRAAVTKTIWYWQWNRLVDQWNRLRSKDKIVNNFNYLIFDNHKDPSFWDKNLLFDKNCLENWKLIWQKQDIDPLLTPYTKIRSKSVRALGIKNEIINKLKEHRIVYLSELWKMKEVMTKEELEIIIDHKIENFDDTKLKSVCTNKTNADKIRREEINWENIFKVKGSDKGLIFKLEN